MDADIGSQSKKTGESGSSQDSIHQVFVDVLGPNRHDQVCCQPTTSIPSHYYDSQCTDDLRPKTEMTEKEAHTTMEQLSNALAQLMIQEEMLKSLQEPWAVNRQPGLVEIVLLSGMTVIFVFF